MIDCFNIDELKQSAEKSNFVEDMDWWDSMEGVWEGALVLERRE
jgi:hypothetical protein